MIGNITVFILRPIFAISIISGAFVKIKIKYFDQNCVVTKAIRHIAVAPIIAL